MDYIKNHFEANMETQANTVKNNTVIKYFTFTDSVFRISTLKKTEILTCKIYKFLVHLSLYLFAFLFTVIICRQPLNRCISTF